jgi:trehalose 6-phosphate synthase
LQTCDRPRSLAGSPSPIADALKAKGGVWFGWDGNTLENETEKLGVDRVGDVDVISSPLTVEDYSQYYIGYANSVLWPLFHYRIDLVDYRPQYFEGYMRVNNKFASLLKPFLKQRDMVWVHDYHLIPFAERLRALGCRHKMGFFLHIPFPPPDILAASSNHAYLIEALLSYDVIGFQTSTDLNNFNRYVEENMPEVDRRRRRDPPWRPSDTRAPAADRHRRGAVHRTGGEDL